MKLWDHQHLLLTLCSALSCASRAAAVIHVSGYEGRDVQVSCSYAEGYESYEKYLCRNDCGSYDVLIFTTQAKKDKYSIEDDQNKQVLTTTIFNLSSEDAGKYWCGVSRNMKDYYPAEIQLSVEPDSCCDQLTNIQSYEEGSVSISCLFDPKYQNNLKYICRGKQPSTCLQQALITSNRKQWGHFTLTDDQESGKFTVTITNLTQKDSGPYLCGIQRNRSLDVFTAVELEVKEWCCVKSNSQSGIVGRRLTMQCLYPPQHGTNRKFLCKGESRNKCEIKVESQTDLTPQADLRFMLQDDASSNIFWVTITELKASDAGTYWCGSDFQWRVGNYTKILLSAASTVIPTITMETITSESTNITGKPIRGTSHFHPVVFIVFAVLLLILISALAIVYKYKCYKVQGAGTNVNQKVIEKVVTVERIREADIYANEEVVVCSKLQSICHHYDDTTADQQDSVYQNFNKPEDMFSNQFYGNICNTR